MPRFEATPVPRLALNLRRSVQAARDREELTAR
jgi:hypothetical protein